MEIKRRIHNGWLSGEKIKISGLQQMFEKYQYIYSQDDNEISLIQFTPRIYDKFCWEIWQIKGKTELFEDVERFVSKEDAEKRIKELLEPKESQS